MSGSTSQKPNIVIVPGAWCRPGLYEPLESRIQKAGYKVQVVDLPSNGDPPSFAPDWTPDIKLIASTVEACVENGETVVVVAHSAGGASTTQAVQGLSLQERQAVGHPGGVARLVYLCAFAPDLGMSPMSHTEVRAFFYWALIKDEIDYPDPNLIDDFLFNGLSAEDIAEYKPFVQKSAWKARQHAGTDVTYVGWKHIPSSYLICQRDKAVPPDMQEMIVAQDGSKFDDVLRIDAGHSPFISHADVTANFVRRAAGEDMTVES